jgi:hypothetical protein
VTPVTLEYTLDGTTWVTITSTAANASNGGCSVPGGSTGCYSWAVPSLDGGGNPIDLGSAKIRVSVTDTPANPVSTQTGMAFQIRSSGPVLSSTTINDGATYAGTTLVNLKVALTDHGFSTSGMKVLVAQAATPVSDCTLPTTPVWLSWTNATTNIPLQLSVVNGTKKICAWAKNSAGLTSQASTFTCTSGIDCNNIDLEVGSPPVISSFTVSSSGGFTAPVGATITINWTANAQGILKLDNNPLSFAYTTDNVTWYDIGTGKDLSTVTDTSEQNPATQVMTWYGGLSGNPVSGSGTTNFSSPSSGFARLRAVARDTANNLSIVAYSKVFNTTMPNGGVWQIYAGSTDFGDGGSGTSASLHAGYGQEIAIDPITGDIYAKDTSVGLRKLDVKTGKVSTYIKSGTLNLSTNGGAITAASRIAISDSVSNIVFSKDGFLYISMGPSGGVYKINVRNNTSTLYLGGGTGHDPSSNPFSVYVKLGPFVLDEDNTAYFWTDCLSDTAPASNAPYRMMKAVQNPDGTAGPLTTVIGNCQYGTMSASGTLASNSILGPFSTLNSAYSQYAGILPLNHGQTIYFGIGGSSGSHPLKVVNDGTDARLYRAASTISSSYATNMSLNPIDGQIYYTSSDFGISKFTPSLTAADNGETAVTSVASGLGTGNDCLNDGIDAATTCVYADTHIDVNSSGTVFFVDGVAKSTFNAYRVRYVDASNKINTILGTLPVYGDGLQKELLRANLAGIYYKKSSNNLPAFPQGLYLTSPSMVFGYIDPATGLYHTLWGNQQNGTISIPAVIGTPMSAQSPMGVVYSGGNGYPLSFDDDGLPWMRVQNYAVTIDSNKKIQSPDNSAPYNGAWDVAADGADPSGFSVSVYGGRQNFALMGNSLFLIGAYFSPPTYPDPTPQIRLLDFTNHVSPIILGKGYTVSQGMTTPTTVAAGDGTTTPVKNSPLSTADTNSTGALQYSNGNLFFTDGNNKLIHYITHPENPLLSSLGTLTINYSGTSVIKNFSVKDDGSQIFIISLAGGLYCYPLTVAGDKTWCPSSGTSPSLYNYAAQIGTLQGGTANMFTWMDDSNLLISTGTQILQYTLPTGP